MVKIGVAINALQSVLTLVVIITAGYILTRKGWFNEDISKLFSKMIVYVSLPALIIFNLLSSFDKKSIMEMGIGFLVPFVIISASYVLGAVVARLIRVEESKRGIFQAMFVFSNAIFSGLPINVALFGEKSVPFVTIYYIANTTMFWILGVYGMHRDGAGRHEPIFSKETLKKIISPSLIAFAFALLLIFMEVKLPRFLMDSCKYVGNLTTPISMIFLGIIIYYIDFKAVKIEKNMFVLLIGKFVVTPLLFFFLLRYIAIPDLMKKVYVIEAAMPVMTQIAIVAQAYDADHRYATVMVTVSTVISLFSIPFYMVILSFM